MVDQDDLDLLSSTDVTVLDNEWTSITVDGKEVILAGLTSAYITDYRRFRSESDSSDRYPRQESISGIGGTVTASHHKPETDWLSAFAAQPDFHILLSHHPEYFPLIPDSVDLILSGHAHGGQIRMYNPLKREWIGTWSPGQGWWPRYTKGVYDGRLVVSAGLSNTTWIPRLCNPTEVVYIEGS
jgi:predicted MPP superfamily phosphohydrolase